MRGPIFYLFLILKSKYKLGVLPLSNNVLSDQGHAASAVVDIRVLLEREIDCDRGVHLEGRVAVQQVAVLE